MSAGVKPENPKTSPQAQKANARLGYGPNNPEPVQFHRLEDLSDDNTSSPNALHAAEEYINGKNQEG